MIHVKCGIKYDILPNLLSTVWENQLIKIRSPDGSKSLMVGKLYRPPKVAHATIFIFFYFIYFESDSKSIGKYLHHEQQLSFTTLTLG